LYLNKLDNFFKKKIIKINKRKIDSDFLIKSLKNWKERTPTQTKPKQIFSIGMYLGAGLYPNKHFQN